MKKTTKCSKMQKMLDYKNAHDYDAIYRENGFKTLTGNISYMFKDYNQYVEAFNPLKSWLENYRKNNKSDENYYETIRLGNKLLRKYNRGYKNSCIFASWNKDYHENPSLYCVN